MRDELTAAGRHQPGFELTTTVERARVAAERIGYPVVIKPRAMEAGIGVVFAADEAQLDAAFGIALSASQVDPDPYRASASAIVEEYAPGPVISVDGAVHKGEYLLGVATGQRPDTTPDRRAVAGIRFGYPERDCVLRSVAVPTRAPVLVTAAPMAEPGAVLRLPPGGYLARHSFVVCEADDTETCLDRLTTAAALVEPDAEPLGPPEPDAPFAMPAGPLDLDE